MGNMDSILRLRKKLEADKTTTNNTAPISTHAQDAASAGVARKAAPQDAITRLRQKLSQDGTAQNTGNTMSEHDYLKARMNALKLQGAASQTYNAYKRSLDLFTDDEKYRKPEEFESARANLEHAGKVAAAFGKQRQDDKATGVTYVGEDDPLLKQYVDALKKQFPDLNTALTQGAEYYGQFTDEDDFKIKRRNAKYYESVDGKTAEEIYKLRQSTDDKDYADFLDAYVSMQGRDDPIFGKESEYVAKVDTQEREAEKYRGFMDEIGAGEHLNEDGTTDLSVAELFDLWKNTRTANPNTSIMEDIDAFSGGKSAVELDKTKEDQQKVAVLRQYQNDPSSVDFEEYMSNFKDIFGKDAAYFERNGIKYENIANSDDYKGYAWSEHAKEIPWVYFNTRIGSIWDELGLGTASEDDAKMYTYLYKTQGEQAARDYVEFALNAVHRKGRMAIIENNARELAKNAPHTSWALARFGNYVGGAGYIGNALLKHLYDVTGREDPVPTDTPMMVPARTASAMDEQNFNHLNEKYGTFDIPLLGEKGLGDLASVGTSTLDSYLSMKTLGAKWGAKLLGLSAATHGYDNMLKRGFTNEQALFGGAMAGIFEDAAERYSLGNLVKAGSPKGFLDLIKKMVIQSGVEASEEAATTIANEVYDRAVNGDRSEFATKVNSYVLNGMNKEDAEKQAWIEWSQELCMDAVGGFLSGGAMYGVPGTFQSIGNSVSNRSVGRAFTSAGNAQGLIDLGLTFNKDSEVYKLASNMNATNAKAKDLGKLYTAMLTATTNTELQNTIRKSFAEQIRERMVQELGDRYNEEDDALASAATDALIKELSYMELTAKEEKILKHPAAQRTYDALKPEFDAVAEKLSPERNAARDAEKLYLDSLINEGKANASTETPAKTDAPTAEAAESVSEDVSEDTNTDAETETEEISSEVSVREALISEGVSEEIADVAEKAANGTVLSDSELEMLNSSPAALAAVNEATKKTTKLEEIGGRANVKASGVETAYEYGKSGLPIESALEAADADMSDEVREAYEKGVAEREQADNERKEEQRKEKEAGVKQGAVQHISEEDADRFGVDTVKAETLENNKVQSAEKALNILAKKLNVRFVLFESRKNKYNAREGADGWYDAKTRTCYIDLFSGRRNERAIMRTVAHELTHHIKAHSLEMYRKLEKFLVDYYHDGDKTAVLEMVATEKQLAEERGDSLTEAEALEEVVASACEMFLADADAIQELANKDKTLFEKMRDWLTDFVDALKVAVKGLKPNSPAAKSLLNSAEALEQARAIWVDALFDSAGTVVEEDASTANTTAESGSETATETVSETAQDDIGQPYSPALEAMPKSGRSNYAMLRNTDILGATDANDLKNKVERDALLKYQENLRKLDEHMRREAQYRADYRMAKDKQLDAMAAKVGKELGSMKKETMRRMAELYEMQRSPELTGVIKKIREKGTTIASKRLRDYKQGVKMRELKDNIKKRALAIANQISNPSNTRHVNELLLAPLGRFLNSINMYSKPALEGNGFSNRDEQFLEAMKGLKKTLDRRGKFTEDVTDRVNDSYGNYFDTDDYIMGRFAELIEHVEQIVKEGSNKGFILELMTADELMSLEEVLISISTSITSINTFSTVAGNKMVYERAGGTIEHCKAYGIRKAMGRAAAFLGVDNIRPANLFKRLGEDSMAIFKAFATGQARLANNQKLIVETSRKIFTQKEASDWAKEEHEIVIDHEGANGKKVKEVVKVSATQLMYIYLLDRREQGRGHLYGEGIRLGDLTKDKVADPGHTLVPSEVKDAIATLSKRQIEVANKLQEVMRTIGAEWGNEVSFIRFGIYSFTDPDYCPIVSDGDHLSIKADHSKGNELFRLLNIAPTRALTKNANNRIMIYDIFDVFSDHMSDMAQYNAMALPIIDAMKWLNYKESEKDSKTGIKDTVSVRESLGNAYGKEVVRYIIELMKDINSKRVVAREDALGLYFLSKQNVSAVAANLRVALLQPTAIARSLTILKKPAVLAAIAKNLNPFTMNANIKEMNAHSGIALWKSQSNYDINVSRSTRDQIKGVGKYRQLIDFTMKPAEIGDKLTWATMWAAAKNQIEATGKYKKGSEEYFRAVSDLFDDVIYETQVVDSVLAKSQIMRSASPVAKLFSAFMSEPTATYNMLLDAWYLYKDEKQKGGDAWRKHGKNIGRLLTTYVISAGLSAIVEALASAWRDDDDYTTFDEKYVSNLLSSLKDNLNPLLKLPLLNTLGETIKSVKYIVTKEGNKGYDARSFLEVLNEITSAASGTVNYIEDGGITAYGMIYNYLKFVSSASGLPISSATREVIDIWNHTGGLITGNKVVRYDPRLSDGYAALYKAINKSDTLRVGEIKAELYMDGADDKDIATGLRKLLKVDYLTQKVDYDSAVKFMIDNGLVDSDKKKAPKDEAYFIIKNWEHGATGTDESFSRTLALKKALCGNGDVKAEIKALKEHGYDDKKIVSAVKSSLKSSYVDKVIEYNTAVAQLKAYASLTDEKAKQLVTEWKCERDTDISFSGLKESYLDGEFNKSTALDYLKTYGGMEADDAAEKARAWEFEKKTGAENYTDYFASALKKGNVSKEVSEMKKLGYADKEIRSYVKSGAREAYIGKNIADKAAEDCLINHAGMKKDEAKAQVLEWKCERENGVAYSEIKELYQTGKLPKAKATDYLKKYGQKDSNDTYYTFKKWDFEKQTGESSSSDYCYIHLYIRSWNGTKLQAEIKDAKAHGKKDDNIAASITSAFKDEYLQLLKTNKNKAATMKSNLITAFGLVGISYYKANTKIDKWSDK